MKKYDVTIIGNLYKDTVYNQDTGIMSYSLGGIVNVWTHLLKIDPTLSLDIHPLKRGEAFIYIDPLRGTKLSSVIDNIGDNLLDVDYIEDSKWYHIAYLDKLDDWSFFERINKIDLENVFNDHFNKSIISVDITEEAIENLDFINKLLHKDRIGKIDYVFVNRDSCNSDWLKSLLSHVNLAVIAHDAKGCTVYHHEDHDHGEHDISYEVKSTNGNVLGAGDAFAAAFICSILNEMPKDSSCMLQVTIVNACNYATDWIQTRND